MRSALSHATQSQPSSPLLIRARRDGRVDLEVQHARPRTIVASRARCSAQRVMGRVPKLRRSAIANVLATKGTNFVLWQRAIERVLRRARNVSHRTRPASALTTRERRGELNRSCTLVDGVASARDGRCARDLGGSMRIRALHRWLGALCVLVPLTSCDLVDEPAPIASGPKCGGHDTACILSHLRVLDENGNRLTLVSIPAKSVQSSQLAPGKGLPTVTSPKTATLTFRYGNDSTGIRLPLTFTDPNDLAWSSNTRTSGGAKVRVATSVAPTPRDTCIVSSSNEYCPA